MAQAIINIDDHTKKILDIIKTRYDLKDESAAIELMATQYEEEILEPELRPEFVEKMQNIMKEEPIDIGTIEDLRARYGHWFWMYRIKISPKLDEIIQKLDKKNKKQVDIILKKAGEIAENPHRYKNLRAPLNNLKRVHIDKHFGYC